MRRQRLQPSNLREAWALASRGLVDWIPLQVPALLAWAAAVLSNGRSGTVARLGGDEFVVLISPLASEQEGRAVLQRLIDTVATPIAIIESTSVSVSASIGVVATPVDGITADGLLHRADAAMCESKRHGKNQVRGFAPLAD